MLHCARVEIPHCASSCAANPIGLLSVFGTLRNYCLVPLLAYAFTRERLIHNSGLIYWQGGSLRGSKIPYLFPPNVPLCNCFASKLLIYSLPPICILLMFGSRPNFRN